MFNLRDSEICKIMLDKMVHEFLVNFKTILQSQSETSGFLKVGHISNNPKDHEHLGFGTLVRQNGIRLASCSRIMLSILGNRIFNAFDGENPQKTKIKYFP